MDDLTKLLTAADGTSTVVLVWVIAVFVLTLATRLAWTSGKDRAADNQFRTDLLKLVSDQQKQMMDQQRANQDYQRKQDERYMAIITRMEAQQSIGTTALGNLSETLQTHSAAIKNNTKVVSDTMGAMEMTQSQIDSINEALQTISQTLDALMTRLDSAETTAEKVGELKQEVITMREKLDDLTVAIVTESKPKLEKEKKEDGLQSTDPIVDSTVLSGGIAQDTDPETSSPTPKPE